MSLRKKIIGLLLHVYPAEWRHEFGAEFEDLLHSGYLGAAVIVNVIAGALSERVLHSMRRITGGGKNVEHTFGAKQDRLARIVTAGVMLVLLPSLLIAMHNAAMAAAVALALAVVIGLAYAYSPRDFEIRDDEFHIKRLIGDVVIPLTQLRFVRDATRADFRGCVRLWGSGGLFGYYGLFWSKALGKSRWYVTDRSKAIVVTDGSQTVLVSPEDRDGFVAAIERADTVALAPSTDAAHNIPRLALAVGATVPVLVMALVAAALLYAPGRPPVDLTGDALVIHSRFYGMTVAASSVDVANVRVVDLRNETGWRTTMRTNGFGNPHYRAGNFKTANGQAVKLFTTGSERLVLLPPSSKDGMPVLLDVDDPDQFVARLRQQWSSQ